MKIILITILAFSWTAMAASQPGVLKTVGNSSSMTARDCKELVDSEWESKYKHSTPKPIHIDYSDGESELFTNILLGLNPQILFGVYLANNVPGDGDSFILELRTDSFKFAHIPAYKTPKGGASCRVLHAWRSNSSALGIRWMSLGAFDETSKDKVFDKKIIEKAL